jgi:hypothetical protein
MLVGVVGLQLDVVLEVIYIYNICGTIECDMESMTSKKGGLNFSDTADRGE